MHELPQGFETYIKLLQTLIISYFPDRRTEMENAGYATKLRQIAFKGFPREKHSDFSPYERNPNKKCLGSLLPFIYIKHINISVNIQGNF